MTECLKCGRLLKDTDYQNHYDTCVLISTMVRDLKKYFKQEVKRKKLEKLPIKKIHELYNQYLDKMIALDKVPIERKNILKRCYIK